MSRKWTGMILAMMIATCTACGETEEVKMIEKPAVSSQEPDTAASDRDDSGNVDGENQTEEQTEGAENDPAGYFFEAEGTEGKVRIVTDVEVTDTLKALGEPLSYFEAASCAFEGLDKMYTYDHFEIDTYPKGEKDYISSIILLDDMIATPEGVYIGMTQSDMETAYGTEYEMAAGACVYTKGNVHLSFIIKDEEIVSITYTSSVLDETNE